MRNRNVWILVAAAVVLLVAAYLLSRGSADAVVAGDGGPAKVTQKKAPVVYPRDMAKLASSTPTPKPAPADAARLDEMQRALLPQNGKGAIFVEANAIRHSPLVEKILRCREKESNNGLNELKEKLGIDPMEDVDRVGFDGDVFAASGFFSKMKVPPELGEGAAYGNGGRIWHAHDDSGNDIVFGKVGDGMLLTAANESEVKAAIDRAQNTSTPTAEMPAGFGEGEVYGTVGKEFLQSMLGDSKDETAQTIARLVTSSTVRMNVDEDAALSLDLKAVDDNSAKDLSSAMKGVFASLHAKAEQEGDQDLAQLLEQARVSDAEGGGFAVDVAVPGETLLRGMGCKPDGTPIEGARRPRRAPQNVDGANGDKATEKPTSQP